MAEVTGSIGNEHVELNNAATESTLKALLGIARGDSATLTALANKAGIDTAAIKAVSDAAESTKSELNGVTKSSKQLTDSSEKLNKEWNRLVDTSLFGVVQSLKQMTAGTATVSGILKNFENMPGPLGAVASGFAKLAEFQEANMKAYQQISSAGASFGGSLSDLRLAASNAYVTLDQFANIIKNNTADFVRIGGSVNEGAVAFAKFSHTLISSKIGDELLALGYTTEQLNNGMATYLGIAGAGSAKELATSKSLQEGAGRYLEELDRLAEITGKNREELNNERNVKKLEADEAVTMARLKTKEERDAFAMNLSYMKGLYGSAGADIAIAQAQGRSVITKEGALLTAITGGAAQKAMQHMNDAGVRFGVGSKQYIAAQTEMSLAMQKGLNDIPTVVYSANDSFKGLSTAVKTTAEQQMAGLTSQEAFNSRDAKIAEDKAIREKSQAADMAASQKTLQEFGQVIMGLIAPIAGFLTPALRILGPAFMALGAIVLLFKARLVGLELIAQAKELRERASMARDLANIEGGSKSRRAGSFLKNYLDLGGNKPNKSDNESKKSGVIESTVAGGPAGGGIGGMLKSLASGMKRLGDPKVMLGAVTLGLLAGTIFIAGKAFKEFTGVSWGDVLIGSVVIAGLAVGAAALAEIAPAIAISAVAIGLLGGAIWLLAKGLKEFPSFAIPGMTEAFTGFGKIVETVFDFVGGVVTGLLTTVKSVFGTIWDVISWPFKMIGNIVSGTISVISSTVDVIVGVFRGLLSGITTIFSTIWDVISWPFKAIGSLVTTVFEGISGAIKWVVDTLSNVLGMIGGVVKGVTGFVGKIFGGGSEEKNEGNSINSADFTKATSVLLEAANKLNIVADKFLSSASSNQENPKNFSNQIGESLENNIPGASNLSENINKNLEQLNSTMDQVLEYMKRTAESTKATHDATRSLNGDVYAR